MIDRYEELLLELGKALGVSLKADEHHSCTILIDEKMLVQIEMEREGERLLIGAHLGVIDPGAFRERVLSAALQANNLPYPQIGTFGYSNHNNQLALFEFLTIEDLNGEKLADYLSLFIGKATEWRDAIASGKPGPETEKDQKSEKPLGLR